MTDNDKFRIAIDYGFKLVAQDYGIIKIRDIPAGVSKICMYPNHKDTLTLKQFIKRVLK